MQIGVLFPTTALGTDAGAMRAFAQAAEELGYAYLQTWEHVAGAGPTHPAMAGDSTLVDL